MGSTSSACSRTLSSSSLVPLLVLFSCGVLSALAARRIPGTLALPLRSVRLTSTTRLTTPSGPLMVGLVNWALLATGTAVQAVHMNPVRTVALAAISNEMDDIWMFIIAPIVGAIIACVVYRYLFQEVN